MFSINRKRFGFVHGIIWFPGFLPVPRVGKLLDCRQCYFTYSKLGYVRKKYLTLLLDLSSDESQIMDSFNATTRNEIRRAIREGVSCEITSDLDSFVAFFNDFAQIKRLAQISPATFDFFRDHVVFTQATRNGEIVAMHSYLVDDEAGIVRLLHSASHFRANYLEPERQSSPSEVSRANRLLHYEDIREFKKRGFAVYDMGGISFQEELKNITAFKMGLCRNVVEVSDYMSINLYLLIKLKALFRGKVTYR